ncbi:hypothetical protein MMC09_003685 [Bachmanniomyces sp. S44760]|nr:hypothetical protein [Bachmanniomyces sp. S44760]
MESFDQEAGEAQYTLNSISSQSLTSIPSQSSLFFKLPREIRDPIYFYALQQPRNGASFTCPHICYVLPKMSTTPAFRADRGSYYGTKDSTDLFLVSRLISEEAREVFYSTYRFHFPDSVDVALVNATLRDTLLPRSRSLITRIGFSFCLPSVPHPTTSFTEHLFHREEEARQAVETVMNLLPNVKYVVLKFMFAGHEVPQRREKEAVARALKIASPLGGFANLSVEGASYSAQGARITRSVREALGC